MEREYTIIIEKDEDGYYVASVAELPGCHTQAKTLDQVLERIKEAIQLYIETIGTPKVEIRKITIKT